MADLAVDAWAPDWSAAYAQHRPYVLSVLRRRCGWLADDERESTMHEAWAVLLEKERGGALDVAAMRPEQVRAYLTQTAINKALDEGRRARSRDESLGERDDFEAPGTAPEEVVDAGMEAERIREIVKELTPRQQQIVKLRYFFDRSPTEVQRLLGLTERAYRRDLERAMATVSDRYELVREGRFCDSRVSLMRAYVAGIAGPNRARDAREHLASCPACRHFVLELRGVTGKVAGALPLPALELAHGGTDRLVELLSSVRDAAGELVIGVKQQGAALAARLDPGSSFVVAGARPGAVAATLGACVAVGGTTYCVVDGIPAPVRAIVQQHSEARREAPRRADRTPAVNPPVVARAPKTASATPTPSQPRPRPRPARSTPKRSASARATAPAAKPAAVTQEFGVEAAGSSPPASTSVTPATPPAAATPAAPPGEFDP